MNKTYTRIFIAIFAITLIGIWGSIHAQTVNGDDDSTASASTSSTQNSTNGSDDQTTPVLISPAISTQTVVNTNGDDDTSQSSTNSSSTGSSVATSTNGSDDTSSTSQTVSTSTSNTIASTTNGDDDTQTTSTTATTTATTTPTTPVVVPPAVNIISSGGSYSSGGSSSSSGGGSIVPLGLSLPGTTTPASTFLSCPLLTSYLQLGSANDNNQVLKLQAFLNTEGFPVSLSGIFNAQTETAVKAFQAKYLTDIMGPWKATTPSGFVYITTRNKINELACKTTLSLTPAELATINAYIANQNASPATGGPTVTPTVGTTPVSGPTTTVGESTTTGTTSPIIGENNTSATANTATVVNAPILQRIWDFFKNLF